MDFNWSFQVQAPPITIFVFGSLQASCFSFQNEAVKLTRGFPHFCRLDISSEILSLFTHWAGSLLKTG